MRLPRLRIRTVMIFTALLALLLAFASSVARHGFLNLMSPSVSSLHAMGEQLVIDIEAWRASHGRYPRTLQEAGLASPTRYQGGFQYEATSTGFILSIGKADGVHVKHSYHSSGLGKLLAKPGWYCMD